LFRFLTSPFIPLLIKEREISPPLGEKEGAIKTKNPSRFIEKGFLVKIFSQNHRDVLLNILNHQAQLALKYV